MVLVVNFFQIFFFFFFFALLLLKQWVQCEMVFSGHFFSNFFNYFFFRFVVAIFDLVHDVEAIHGLC